MPKAGNYIIFLLAASEQYQADDVCIRRLPAMREVPARCLRNFFIAAWAPSHLRRHAEELCIIHRASLLASDNGSITFFRHQRWLFFASFIVKALTRILNVKFCMEALPYVHLH